MSLAAPLFAICLALLLDAALGEPRKFHPLVGFGWLTQRLERRYYRASRLAGAVAVMLLILPLTFIAILLSAGLSIWLPTQLPARFSDFWVFAWEVAILYFVIGRKSLCQHALAVYKPLADNNLKAARRRVGYMVSRDTRTLDSQAIATATTESVLENGNDAVFGALFWFVVAGAPGALLFRLSNTLDAMWGYKNDHYLKFGWAAARLDDCLNFIPARLTVLAYGLAGRPMPALRCYWHQGRHWKSPNAGPVMAAGAGSLSIVLGGSASYLGQHQHRPVLGQGRQPVAADIKAAVGLVNRATGLWVAAIALSIAFSTG